MLLPVGSEAIQEFMHNFRILEISLLPVSFLLTGLVRIFVFTVPFKQIYRITRSATTQPTVKELDRCTRIARVVQNVSYHTPWESNCLVQSLSVFLLARLFAIPTELNLGARSQDDGMLETHAWLTCGSHVVIGDIELGTYSPFPNEGAKAPEK